jgi:hypothetical protein
METQAGQTQESKACLADRLRSKICRFDHHPGAHHVDRYHEILDGDEEACPSRDLESIWVRYYHLGRFACVD